MTQQERFEAFWETQNRSLPVEDCKELAKALWTRFDDLSGSLLNINNSAAYAQLVEKQRQIDKLAEDLRKVSREFQQLAEDEANLRTDLQNAQARIVELTADKARMDWIESALWHDHRIGNGLVIWPFTAAVTGERFIELQDLGDEDGSNLGDTLTKKWHADLRSAIDAAMKGGAV